MDSIDYYSKYANLYFENTVDLNMEEYLDRFIGLLDEGASVLDLGCGSGRDSLYFIEKGFDVTALDGTKELCELASIHIGQDVLKMTYNDMDFQEVFDGVWACASLVHLKADELNNILDKIVDSLKENGYLYFSLKYGDFEGIKNSRYFKYYKTKELKDILANHTSLEVVEIFKSNDIRDEKGEELWINVIAKKIGMTE